MKTTRNMTCLSEYRSGYGTANCKRRFRRAVMPLVSGAVLFVASSSFVACSGGENNAHPDNGDMLVSVGDSSLYEKDVLRLIPGGISSADSADMYDGIVHAWVERLLLRSLAEENVEDMERIDRLTAEYRNRLIVESYRRSLRESRENVVSDKRIREYYIQNADDLILERPIVKGIYVKLSANAHNLDKVRYWVKSASSKDIDNLEKAVVSEALQYSFFEDRWVDWQQIADRIPYRFFDADAFVESARDFETEYQGAVYLLHISSFMRSGEKMPEEFAAPIISEILSRESSAEFEKRLVSDLCRRASKEGILKTGSYKKLKF